ncbi:hypothetical protein YC2023_114872 [Brassica napus]
MDTVSLWCGRDVVTTNTSDRNKRDGRTANSSLEVKTLRKGANGKILPDIISDNHVF